MKNIKKYTVGTLSVLVATSLITTSVTAEEAVNEIPTQEAPAANGGYGYNGPTGGNPVLSEGGSGSEDYGYTPPVQTAAPAPAPAPVQTVAPAPQTIAESYYSQKPTAEEQAYLDNYLRELSKSVGGAPVGITGPEAEEILKRYRSGDKVNFKKPNSEVTTVLAKNPTVTENKTISNDKKEKNNKNDKKEKNDNLEHSVVEDKEIEKGLHSVKFVTLDKKTNKKKVHDFKKEENNKDKEKEKEKVDYSKEPARVGTTPGAAYAIVELEDGVYGQLSVERKTGKKLITAKYDLLKETIEKGSWEYKDEEVVEVKKEDADDKVEETTTTKSR